MLTKMNMNIFVSFIVWFVQLLGWLEEKLPSCSKLPSETQSVIHPVLISLEDRSAEVRKKAQAVVPLLMTHVGYEAMLKTSGKLQVRKVYKAQAFGINVNMYV